MVLICLVGLRPASEAQLLFLPRLLLLRVVAQVLVLRLLLLLFRLVSLGVEDVIELEQAYLFLAVLFVPGLLLRVGAGVVEGVAQCVTSHDEVENLLVLIDLVDLEDVVVEALVDRA